MNRRIRGAATVGVIWVIVLLALVLFAGAGIYVLASEKADNEKKVKDAQTLEAQARAKYEESAGKVRALAQHVGFRDETDPNSDARPDEIKGRLTALQESYGFVGKDASNLARVVERFEAQVNDLTRQLAEAKQAQTTAEASRASTEQNLRDMTRQKDEATAAVQRQLSDERDRNGAQETSDKTRIEELNGRLNAAEARARAEKEELEKQVAALNDDVRKREGRIAEMSKKLEVIRLPDEPDGSVVAVSTANTCYIDLGSKQLLRRGTRFKVFTYGKNGAMREKGMVEVSSVNEAMAECTVVDLKDRFDPISRGDKISAPNYDPEMPREFVLTGRFPSGYSRAMVADRLRALGANVSEKVGPTTDFLVMGDAEPAAASGEADAAAEGDGSDAGSSESAEMQLAQLYRVQVLPVREILEFLKYE